LSATKMYLSNRCSSGCSIDGETRSITWGGGNN
jgi:hypothetical protein